MHAKDLRVHHSVAIFRSKMMEIPYELHPLEVFFGWLTLHHQFPDKISVVKQYSIAVYEQQLKMFFHCE
jgi:hypothetical protein